MQNIFFTYILHILHVLTNNKNTMLQGIQKHVQCMSLKKGSIPIYNLLKYLFNQWL